MGLWDDICDGASAIGGAVGGVVHGVEEGVVQGVQRVVEDVRDTVNGIVDTVIGVVVGAAEAIGQAFGVNPHGSPTTPCPYAPTPPRVGDLSVLVKRRDNDQPIPGAAVSVGTLTRRNGTTGGQGTISFDPTGRSLYASIA